MAEELDRTLGQLLSVADDAYWPAIRLGFTEYIEREQAWREKVGLGLKAMRVLGIVPPHGPATEPGAGMLLTLGVGPLYVTLKRMV